VYYPWSERNGQGRLKQIRTGTTEVPTDTQDLEYGYDPAGNVVTIVDGKMLGGTQAQSFGYDPLDRLVSASAAGGSAGQGQYDESYTYNEIGNLTSKGGVTYTYPTPGSPQPHAVTGASNGGSFVYDYNGNMTSRRLQTGGPTYTQTWDDDNRLASVTVPISGSEQTTTFTYDGNGALVKKESGGETTVYVGTYYEKNVTTGQVTRYYFFNGQRIAMRQGDVLYYIAGDHLGSTSLVLNSDGTVHSQARYYPYGVERWSSGTLPTDYRFTGQRFEAGLGIYAMGARWYDSELGRWISPDTLVPEPTNPQSLNRYSWVLGNPLKFVDPTGHKEEGECSPNDEGCEGQPPPPIDEVIVEILQGMVDAINDPARTEPILIALDDGTTLVIMPLGSKTFQDRKGFEWAENAVGAIGVLGAINDAIEGISLVAGGPWGPADFFGGTDTLIAIAGSACSGDMWFGKPHPDLPAMWLVGQDVLWTAGVDGVGPHFAGAAGAMLTGNLGGYAGGKWSGDLFTTGLSIGYDVGRVKRNIPTVINGGWGWSTRGGLQGYVVVYP
jgi:RHS repeat-associated protein